MSREGLSHIRHSVDFKARPGVRSKMIASVQEGEARPHVIGPFSDWLPVILTNAKGRCGSWRRLLVAR